MRRRRRTPLVLTAALGLVAGGGLISVAQSADRCGERSGSQNVVLVEDGLCENRWWGRGSSRRQGPTPPAPDSPTQEAATRSKVLALPRIPWEGGAEYWKQFPRTDAAGWDDPSFFPVGVWWSGVSTPAEVAFDRDLGLRFYVLMNPDTDFNLIQDNGMYWVGGALRNLEENSPAWVGDFIDDEVDGRFEPPARGFEHLQGIADRVPPERTGRFRYVNYTSGILTYDRAPKDAERYVNGFSEAVSVDHYFYSTPQCDWEQNWSRFLVEIPKDRCRTAHSYGVVMNVLRERDAADDKLQPLFAFVENMSPEGEEQGFHPINGDQIKGAVMASIINEARGIVYFNQSFSGPCGSGNVFRRAQVEPDGCAVANTDAAREVNRQIAQLARVLNTQSYQWDFGPGLDTMLKVHDGSAYIFAMSDGRRGRRTFSLPPGLGRRVDVVGENRRLLVRKGRFRDRFASENSYHIYRIRLR